MWPDVYYSKLEVFTGSHLNHCLAKDRKDCHVTQTRQADTDAHAPSYGTTCAPHVSDAVILIDQRAGAGPLARVMGWGGVGVGSCTVLRLGQEGVDKQDQGNAQQGALASYTDPTGTGMLSSVYTILSASWDSLFTYMVELFIFILFLPLFSPIKLE